MPERFPKEFRDGVVRVARARGANVTLAQIAEDFGVHVGTLDMWLREARIDGGEQRGVARSESGEMRQLRKRKRLLVQDVGVLRRTTAYLSQAYLPGN